MCASEARFTGFAIVRSWTVCVYLRTNISCSNECRKQTAGTSVTLLTNMNVVSYERSSQRYVTSLITARRLWVNVNWRHANRQLNNSPLWVREQMIKIKALFTYLPFLPTPHLALCHVDIYIHLIDVLIFCCEQLYTILKIAADVT
jgi:hypothetical protein